MPDEPVVERRTIAGIVEFAERIGLTPDSRLEVRLLDVSLADAPPTEIASTMVDAPGQSPLAFSIDYDPADIQPGHSYSVGVKVFDRNKLILVSDTVNPVLGDDAGEEVRILVVRVAVAGQGN